MKKIILIAGIFVCALATHGCTVTISSTESATHSHTPAGVAGPQGKEGKPGVNKLKVSEKHASLPGGSGLAGADGFQGVAGPASLTISPKKNSGLDAKFVVEAF